VSGDIAGAGLDVFENEPYNGKLCELTNVILTPHSATSTIETRTAMEIECVEKALKTLN
jgi:D-3-phosphoglycerate dehydrogenase